MRDLTPFRLWLLILIAAVLPATLHAQMFADRLPAGPAAYVSWCGSESMGPLYAQSHLQHVIADSQFSLLVNDFLPKLSRALADRDPAFKEMEPMLRGIVGPLFRHSWAIYFGSIDITDAKAVRPRLILLCDAGAETESLLQNLGLMRDALKARGSSYPINVARHDTQVVFTAGYGTTDISLLLPGPKAPSLATDPKFKSAMSKVGASPAFVIYADVDSIRTGVSAYLKANLEDDEVQQWTRFREQVGLDDVHQFSFTGGFDGAGWSTQLFIGAPAPLKPPLASLLGKPPLDSDLLAAIPSTATRAAGARADLPKLLDVLRSVIALSSAEGVSQFEAVMSQLAEFIGMDVQKDLLPSFGDQWIYYHDPSLGGFGWLGNVLINRSPKPDIASAQLNKAGAQLAAYAAGQGKRFGVGPLVTLKSMKVGSLQVDYLAAPFVSPAWVVDRGRIYLGLYPQIAVAAAQQGAQRGRSILDHPGFAGLRKRSGNVRISAFTFADLPTVVRETYPGWLLVSNATDLSEMFQVPSPSVLLPPLRSLAGQLEPAGSVAWSDAAGFHVQGYSPFIGSSLLSTDPTSFSALETAVAEYLLPPILARVRASAEVQQSVDNLKQIGAIAIQFAKQHEGKFPDKLGDLINPDVSPDLFSNPRLKRPPAPRGMTKGEAADWVDENSDYAWLGAGIGRGAGPGVMIACEEPNHLQDGVNVLFADGHVELRPLDAVRKLIHRSKSKRDNAPDSTEPSN